MEQFGTLAGRPGLAPRAEADAFALASRRVALEACLGGLDSGPVLITGEAGTGKSWLAERLAAEAPDPRRWIAVDLTPTMTAEDLVRALLHRLGAGTTAADRLALADHLADEAAEGRTWGLILDEAHLAPDGLLEDIRVLSNRQGCRDGFAAVVLVGQSILGRRLATRPLAALDTRMAARVHLRPLDVDEAGVLIDRLAPGRVLDADALERSHRDAGGNPRRLLAMALAGAERTGRAASPTFTWVRPMIAAPARVGGTLAEPAPEPRTPGTSWSPPIDPAPDHSQEGPSPDEPARAPAFEPFTVRTPFAVERPPLAMDDGMIEVGWDSGPEEDLEEEAGSSSGPQPSVPGSPDGPDDAPGGPPSASATEHLADHYAALQAWQEWSRNQGREAEYPAPGGSLDDLPDSPLAAVLMPAGHSAPADAAADPGPGARPAGLVWADGEHEFAPYSQLFPRLRQTRDSDG